MDHEDKRKLYQDQKSRAEKRLDALGIALDDYPYLQNAVFEDYTVDYAPRSSVFYLLRDFIHSDWAKNTIFLKAIGVKRDDLKKEHPIQVTSKIDNFADREKVLFYEDCMSLSKETLISIFEEGQRRHDLKKRYKTDFKTTQDYNDAYGIDKTKLFYPQLYNIHDYIKFPKKDKNFFEKNNIKTFDDFKDPDLIEDYNIGRTLATKIEDEMARLYIPRLSEYRSKSKEQILFDIERGNIEAQENYPDLYRKALINTKNLEITASKTHEKLQFVSDRIREWCEGREDLINLPVHMLFEEPVTPYARETLQLLHNNGIYIAGQIIIEEDQDSLRAKGLSEDAINSVRDLITDHSSAKSREEPIEIFMYAKADKLFAEKQADIDAERIVQEKIEEQRKRIIRIAGYEGPVG